MSAVATMSAARGSVPATMRFMSTSVPLWVRHPAGRGLPVEGSVSHRAVPGAYSERSRTV